MVLLVKLRARASALVLPWGRAGRGGQERVAALLAASPWAAALQRAQDMTTTLVTWARCTFTGASLWSVFQSEAVVGGGVGRAASL